MDDGRPFPGRELILYLTFVVVIGTLLLQGLTLPELVRALPLPEVDPRRRVLIQAQAQNDASLAAADRLDELLTDPRNRLPEALEQRLRRVLERRQNGVWERLGAAVDAETGESADAVYRRLGKETIAAERDVFVELRDGDRIDDELLRRLIRQLDYEEALVDHAED
jgi:CPA1 family monovalent cation:H+ antiporter